HRLLSSTPLLLLTLLSRRAPHSPTLPYTTLFRSTAIDPTYGTLDDFDELVTQAKSRGIRIILDMVFNHTSTQHAWFREALNKESPYRQFYIWRDGEPETPPNNWRSKFGGSAWRWHAESEQYYLHLFAPEQAD